jgi:phosphoribosyl-ATP pyrophosphohydrolase/phosphoribosyl-AMP cyclohydrolase
MNSIDGISFREDGLIPAIVQSAADGEVLMLAYMNAESLAKTLESGETWFYSRRRRELWHKGETSGNRQLVEEIRLDCDGDALLLRVRQIGQGACHTGARSCFSRVVRKDSSGSICIEFIDEAESNADDPCGVSILNELYGVICDRKAHPVEGSYTCYLFREGLDKILKKVGEECAETIIGSKNRSEQEIVYETADLIYHLLVMLAFHGIAPDQVWKELAGRR